MQMPCAHEMMSSLLLEPAEDATMAATGEWKVSRLRRWAHDRALDTWDSRVENGSKVEAWMVVVLFGARGGRGIGASGLIGGLSGSFSQLSEVEQKTESEKSGVLAPVVLADPDPSPSGRV
jgi:hypothetical protein